MATLIFSLLENTFLNRSFDEKQEIAKRGKHMMNKSSYTQIFLLLSLMRYLGPQVLFYAIWNKAFGDHAHLTDRMQWQKKSKKHIYIY